MNYYESYKKYLKTVINKADKTKYISESSQRSYASILKRVSKYFIEKGYSDIEVYEIDDIKKLSALDVYFKSDKELAHKNETGRNQYSVSFHHYMRMIANNAVLDYEFYEEEEKEVSKILKKKTKYSKKLIDNTSYDSNKVTTIITRERNREVKAYTRQRANGVCDLCGCDAPFEDSNGVPYLESHHVIMLSDGGPDVIYNTVALCPNCHRKMHSLALENDKNKLILRLKSYIEEENDEELKNKFSELFEL